MPEFRAYLTLTRLQPYVKLTLGEAGKEAVLARRSPRADVERLENESETMNQRAPRNGLIYIIILAVVASVLFAAFGIGSTPTSRKNISLTDFVQLVQDGKVKHVRVEEEKWIVQLKDGTSVVVNHEPDVSVPETLKQYGVPDKTIRSLSVSVAPRSRWEDWAPILTTLIPLLFIGAFFIFLMRQAQGAGGQAFSFGKSRARMYTGDKPTVTFDDVAGAEEAKQELQEVVEFLREPQKFAALGARIPKGVLLIGPPGTGKTLMAKAIAGEAGVPFFSISGSEFVEMFVGVGASRVRDLFDQAKRNAPCIIFIDEIDAVGRHRGAGLGGSHDEREQTLNQILVEMDGFDTNTNVIVIAATNRPDILDPALLRPGRFDRRVVMDRPDIKGRRAILEVHVRGKPLAPDVDLDTIARLTPGFVGADIENLVNEAAILAARRNKRAIGMDEFTEAIERVALGPERRSRVISPEEKRIVAYHEAGHAVVMRAIPGNDPVQKVTIIPRGWAGGYTMPLPEDRTLNFRDRYKAQLAGLLGGRAAEQIIFGEVTTGAANDLERVTALARRMVMVYGMSDRLGPMNLGERDELIFLGKELAERRNYSEEVAREIDHEVRRLVEEAYERAKRALLRHKAALVAVAERLLEVETIDRAEFERIFTSSPVAEDITIDVPAGAAA